MVAFSMNVAITCRTVAYLAVQSGLQVSATAESVRTVNAPMIMDRCEHRTSPAAERGGPGGVTALCPARAQIDMTDRTGEGVAVDSQVRRP